ncbi:MAG: ferritin-like domain-containing protein, partial [Eubacteriales bacterium]
CPPPLFRTAVRMFSGISEIRQGDEMEFLSAFDQSPPRNTYGMDTMPQKPYEDVKKQKNAQSAQPAVPADPFPYHYPQNRDLALQLIREAVGGEAEDKDFYAQIIRAATSQEDKEILTTIRNDEMKHSELLRKLYYELTGQMLKTPAPYENATRMTYCQALKKALLGEVAAISKYRKILFGMQDRRHINMLTEILTDEIRHADLYGLLISMNGCYPRRESDKKTF